MYYQHVYLCSHPLIRAHCRCSSLLSSDNKCLTSYSSSYFSNPATTIDPPSRKLRTVMTRGYSVRCNWLPGCPWQRQCWTQPAHRIRMFLAIDNGDKGEPWQKQAGTQLIKMHTKVLEIILMHDNSDCNFEKALTKATMAHPTKMRAAILAIIMYKTTFKL